MRRLMMNLVVLGILACNTSVARAGFSPQEPRWDDDGVSSHGAIARRIERQRSATQSLATHCRSRYGGGGYRYGYDSGYGPGYHSTYYRTGYSHVPRYPAYAPRPYPRPRHGHGRHRHHRHHGHSRHSYGGGSSFGLYFGF